MKLPNFPFINRLSTLIALFGLILVFPGGCSVKRTAVNLIGDALSSGGGVYASDDDPELIREALPFGLKLQQALLEVSPDHQGLLLSTARGFAAYGYLLQNEADERDTSARGRATELRARAHKMYLRAQHYALRALELGHPGFASRLEKDFVTALSATTRDDVPFLYWCGASWAGALSVARTDLGLIAVLPVAGSMVRRVLDLDENFDHGAAHEFLISYEGSRPAGSVELARRHYRRALEISGGRRASVHLALAEAVSIREQNLSEFRALIDAALAIDPEKFPEQRLVNSVAQRRARWLESRIPDLFLNSDHAEVKP